jgi:hypothetical protein
MKIKGRLGAEDMTSTSCSWRTNWVTSKCEIALALANGAGGAGYGEAAIIVSSALTALAAEMWPGPRQDRARFIELLVRMSPDTPSLSTVSIPLLVQHLRTQKEHSQEAVTLANRFLPVGTSLVVTGPDVDRSELEILALVPSIQVKLLRRFSYACLLYEELRSSYAHQYQPGPKADSWPMTMLRSQAVSYVNKITERRIHFHIEWLAQLAIEVVKEIDATLAKNPSSLPAIWWINEEL